MKEEIQGAGAAADGEAVVQEEIAVRAPGEPTLEHEPPAKLQEAHRAREEESGPEQQQPSRVPRIGTGKVVIAARRLSLWYGQVIGINDISLDICQGVVGLLGPNGAGKSTLFKVLTGQLRPSTGTASVLGEPVWRNAKIYDRIGFVPEQDAFYEDMSGREFVTYLTRLQGFSRQDAEGLAAEALQKVDMADRADRPIREYSKGMRQRIKIAQALAHRPRVLFLDEPLTGTDPVGRRAIIDLIGALGDEGHTVVVSSHVLHEVEQMTRTILLINKGRVLAEGDVGQIRDMIDAHPHTIFVDCDDPRRFAALMAPYGDVVSITFLERGLQIATRDPDACYSRIPALALDHGIALRGMTSPDNNLMAIFRYLIES